jgi:tetratricopeptide (TPR) repeat protein
VLLDRQRVKFWQKWVFGFMALVMAGFLLMIPLGGFKGCGGTSSATDQVNSDIVKYQAAVKADPKNVDAWRSLGESYMLRANQQSSQAGSQQTTLTASQLADYGASAASYEKAVKILSKRKGKAARQLELDTLDQLVSVYLFRQDYKMATSTYGRITALRPKDAESFFNMATTAISAGDTNAALLAFGRFLELAPNSPDAAAARTWIKANTPKASPSPSPSSTNGTGP